MRVFPRVVNLFEGSRQLLKKASPCVGQMEFSMGALEQTYLHPLFKGFNLLTNGTG